MIYLHKILPVFVMPIMLIIYLLIFSLWKKKKWPIYTAIISFYIFSTPFFVNVFFTKVEGNDLRLLPKNVSNADAIVVLSGMINNVKSKEGVYPEWADSDRFFGAVELYKAGKASKIIFTGGKMPWDTTSLTEGEILKKFALLAGIPDSAIILTNKVNSTYDEAQAIVSCVGKGKNIILVTSAFHMQRSKMLLEKQNLIIIPYKVDWKVNRLNKITFMSFLPDAEYFKLFNVGYRELIGRFFYYLQYF